MLLEKESGNFVPLLSLFCKQGHRETSAVCLFNLDNISFFHCTVRDDISLRVIFIIRIFGILINITFIGTAFVEEIEVYDSLMTILVTFTANEPIICSFCFT